MPHYAAFHLGLHCLPKYTFRSLHSLCMLINFSLSCTEFFLNNFFKTFLHEHISVKSMVLDQDQVGPDPSPNYMQR